MNFCPPRATAKTSPKRSVTVSATECQVKYIAAGLPASVGVVDLPCFHKDTYSICELPRALKATYADQLVMSPMR